MYIGIVIKELFEWLFSTVLASHCGGPVRFPARTCWSFRTSSLGWRWLWSSLSKVVTLTWSFLLVPRKLFFGYTAVNSHHLITESRSGIGTRRKGKGGENNAKLNNSITEWHFDAIFYMKTDIPFLFLIALTNCAHLLLAWLASKNRVLYSEGRVYKRTPELAASPQSTARHSTGNTSVKDSVTRTKSATATHME